MKVCIIKYNAGNIYSVVNAMKRLGIDPIVTDNPEVLMSADRILFPGQGEAKSTMRYLRERGLDNIIKNLKQPVLGICIGQQLLCKHSEEGDTDCIGIFQTDVKRFIPNAKEQKVPAMGWNALHNTHHPLFDKLPPDPYAYFVHSYYVPICEWTAATATHILPYSAALHKENFYATQFHPEKSGQVGEQILKNFLDLNDGAR